MSNICLNFPRRALPNSQRCPLLAHSPLLAALRALPSSQHSPLQAALSLLGAISPPRHALPSSPRSPPHRALPFSPRSPLVVALPSSPRPSLLTALAPPRIVSAPFSLPSTPPSSLCSLLLAALSPPHRALPSSPCSPGSPLLAALSAPSRPFPPRCDLPSSSRPSLLATLSSSPRSNCRTQKLRACIFMVFMCGFFAVSDVIHPNPSAVHRPFSHGFVEKISRMLRVSLVVLFSSGQYRLEFNL